MPVTDKLPPTLASLVALKVPVLVFPLTVKPLFNVVASATVNVLLIVAAPVNVVAPVTDKVPVLVLFATVKFPSIIAEPFASNESPKKSLPFNNKLESILAPLVTVNESLKSKPDATVSLPPTYKF